MPDAIPLNPGLAAASVAAVNDSLAPDIHTASDQYALRFSGEIGAYLLRRQGEAVESVMRRIPSGELRVLDVGGGHGQLTELFVRLGHHVVIHGSSAACFSRVQDVKARCESQIEFLMSSIWEIPATERSFDLVCSFRLLGHVSEWRALLAQKCRLAERYVICEFAAPQGFQRLAPSLFSIKRQLEPDTRPFTPFEIPEVQEALEGNGFQLIAIERQFVLPIVLHRRVRSAAFSARIEAAFAAWGLTERLGSPVVLLAERRP